MLFLSLFSTLAHAEDPAKTVSIEVSSTKPGLVISGILARATAVSSTGAVAQAALVQDLCTAPCTVEASPGFTELYGKGRGHVATPRRFELRSGTYQLQVQPGSSALLYTGRVSTYVGVLALTSFGTLAYMSKSVHGMDESFGPAIGGAAGGAALLAGGITLMVTQRGKWTLAEGPATGP
jgi:hypothetical protein